MNDEVESVLTDGYKFKAKVNGNTYYTETVVDEKELEDTNLVSVTIAGQKYENMTCTAHDNEHVCFRQFSADEMARKALAAKIQYVAMMGGITL